jgi:hypothetical protein
MSGPGWARSQRGLAFLATAFVIVLSYRDRVREQARLVSAWIDDISFVGVDGPMRRVRIRFRNGSTEPVYQLRLIGVVDRTKFVETGGDTTVPPVWPDKTGTAVVQAPEDDRRLGVVVEFRDARGRRWRFSICAGSKGRVVSGFVKSAMATCPPPPPGRGARRAGCKARPMGPTVGGFCNNSDR